MHALALRLQVSQDRAPPFPSQPNSNSTALNHPRLGPRGDHFNLRRFRLLVAPAAPVATRVPSTLVGPALLRPKASAASVAFELTEPTLAVPSHYSPAHSECR